MQTNFLVIKKKKKVVTKMYLNANRSMYVACSMTFLYDFYCRSIIIKMFLIYSIFINIDGMGFVIIAS